MVFRATCELLFTLNQRNCRWFATLHRIVLVLYCCWQLVADDPHVHWRPTLWNCRPVPSTVCSFLQWFFIPVHALLQYLTVKLILPINIEKKIALMIRHVMLRHVSCLTPVISSQFWLIGFWCLYYRARVNKVSNLNILRFVGVSSPVLPLNFWCGIYRMCHPARFEIYS